MPFAAFKRQNYSAIGKESKKSPSEQMAFDVSVRLGRILTLGEFLRTSTRGREKRAKKRSQLIRTARHQDAAGYVREGGMSRDQTHSIRTTHIAFSGHGKWRRTQAKASRRGHVALGTDEQGA